MSITSNPPGAYYTWTTRFADAGIADVLTNTSYSISGAVNAGNPDLSFFQWVGTGITLGQIGQSSTTISVSGLSSSFGLVLKDSTYINWGGLIDSGSGVSITQVWTSFVVPSISYDTEYSGTTEELGLWAGIGGIFDSVVDSYYDYPNPQANLWQAGLDLEAVQNDSGNGFTTSYCGFYEAEPLQVIHDVLCGMIQSGDTVSVYLETNLHAGTCIYYVNDTRVVNGVPRTISSNNSASPLNFIPDTHTAEFVAEAPSYDFGTFPLPVFGSFTFTSIRILNAASGATSGLYGPLLVVNEENEPQSAPSLLQFVELSGYIAVGSAQFTIIQSGS